MNLGIISDCIHVRNENNEVGSDIHVLVKQLNHLSTHFDNVTICAPILNGNNSIKQITYYSENNISFISIPLAGGNSLIDKLKLLFILPVWITKLVKTTIKSDVLYLRSPNNISIPGFLISYLFRKKQFSTYTGTWIGYPNEPLTYRYQRNYLANLFKGPVFVYGPEKDDKENIFNTFSPSYSINDWHEETNQVEERINNLKLNQPMLRELKFITVGSLNKNKNQIFILKTLILLKKKGIKFKLFIAGAGELDGFYKKFVKENGLENEVSFLGNVKQNVLREYYRKSDFLIQAPFIEGFGKVPVEGFFHGVIPFLSNVNISSNLVGDGQRGFVFELNNEEELLNQIYSLAEDSQKMLKLITNAREYVKNITLEAWSNSIIEKINEYYYAN